MGVCGAGGFGGEPTAVYGIYSHRLRLCPWLPPQESATRTVKLRPTVTNIMPFFVHRPKKVRHEKVTKKRAQEKVSHETVTKK